VVVAACDRPMIAVLMGKDTMTPTMSATSLARFRANTPAVSHETIDGEVIMIHFDTGSYYSLDGAGAVLWGLIEAGATADEIVHGLVARFDGDHATIRVAVQALLADLAEEGLIVRDDAAAPAEAPELTGALPTNGTRPAFVAPALQKYTDMQELLLLDPVHEVDDRGWPMREQPLANAR
jgi:hypothetical protein